MVRRVAAALIAATLSCSSSKRAFECLDVVLGAGANLDYLIDEVGILPARRFDVRLASDSVYTWNLTGRRLGLVLNETTAQSIPDAAWRPEGPDSLTLYWWGGFDGVRLHLGWNDSLLSGQGIQHDDAGCPGGDYCYVGSITASPIPCPSSGWLQSDSTGWIPWRDSP